MTISNFSIFSKIKKVITNIITDHGALLAYIGFVIIVFVLTFYLLPSSDSNEKSTQVRAKEIIINGYPELICTADSGNFRIYPTKSYDIIHNDNGYVLWFKNETMTDGNSFNLTKCELSSVYKTNIK